MDAITQELRTAQLTALQNQITPHYIVNTLDAVRMKLILDGQSESAELLRCFQESLRTYAFPITDTVSLRQELIFLEDYMKLQSFRLLGRLTWTFQVDTAALDQPIPRFILQPLVENAIRHGFDPTMDASAILVCGSLVEDTLCLSISDNGRGFSKATPTGIGIQNVNKRLQLLYGEDCTVSIKSISGSGTCAALRLPLKGGELP